MIYYGEDDLRVCLYRSSSSFRCAQDDERRGFIAVNCGVVLAAIASHRAVGNSSGLEWLTLVGLFEPIPRTRSDLLCELTPKDGFSSGSWSRHRSWSCCELTLASTPIPTPASACKFFQATAPALFILQGKVRGMWSSQGGGRLKARANVKAKNWLQLHWILLGSGSSKLFSPGSSLGSNSNKRIFLCFGSDFSRKWLFPWLRAPASAPALGPCFLGTEF